MKKRLLPTLLLVSLPAYAQSSADVLMYFFQQGSPVEGLTVMIDGEAHQSGTIGSLALRLAPGDHRVVVKQKETHILSMGLSTLEDENLQLIVTLVDGQPPQVDIESSAGKKSVQLEERKIAGEPGALRGRVVSSENGEAIAGARLFISGVAADARTDAEGRFEIELLPGDYQISVLHPDFSTQNLSGVQIASKQTTQRDVALTPAGLELAEFVVLAPYIEGSVASVVALQREAASVSEVLGAEQMSKSGDSNAAAALKRATGLTIEDGKFVVVRGQPSRYTKTLWNNGELPSPDPNRRIVPLDLFPTEILSSVDVQKSYSADKPGDFGGGLVELNTRGIPQSSFAEVSLSVGMNTETTGKSAYGYEGGDTDWLGTDDGTRALPQALDEATEAGQLNLQSDLGYLPNSPELEPLGESFSGDWQLRETTPGPDAGLSVAGGRRFETGYGDYGILVSTNYDRSSQLRTGPENEYEQVSNGELRLGDAYDVTQNDTEYSLGGMLTLGGQWGEDHSVTGNTFFSRKTLDRASFKDGLSAENDQYRREYVLEWVERELRAHQLTGHHRLAGLGGVGVSWQWMTAQSTRDSPDRRSYEYLQVGEEWLFVESSPTREYQYLTDDTDSYGADIDIPLIDRDALSAGLKVGWSELDKERDSTTLTYKLRWQPGDDPPSDLLYSDNPDEILSPEYIGPDGWYLSDLTDPSQQYRGSQSVEARYLQAEIKVGKTLRLVSGRRYESADLRVESIDQQTRLQTDDVLPATALTWFMGNSSQLRFGVGETVARPELNELSKTYYYDADSGDKYIGNPDLKPTYIDSYDLRWEWYPSQTEIVTAGIFYKDYKDPIEVVWVPFATEDVRSFENADAAEVTGLEVGFRSALGRFGSFWKAFTLSGNASFIDSTVKVDGAGTERPLQGQAPYVYNLLVGYEGERNEVNLLFNWVGERLDQVGEEYGTTKKPDVYLQPLTQLDMNWRYRWRAHSELKFSAKNLLDPTIEYLQGDEIYRSYKKGREFAVSLKLKY